MSHPCPSPDAVVIDLKPVSVETMPDDADGQVECMIARMVRLAQADASSPEIQRDAAAALHEGRGNPVDGVHRFVRSRLNFVPDQTQAAPYQSMLQGVDDYYVEAITRPRDLSRVIAANGSASGDCDDFSTYACSLLIALQVPCKFVTVAAGAPGAPRDYSHVYCVAYPGGSVRVPIDASHGAYAGWEYKAGEDLRRREWDCGTGGSPRLDAVITVVAVVAAFWLYRTAVSAAKGIGELWA